MGMAQRIPAGDACVTLPVSALTRVLVLLFGLCLVQIKAGDSADFWSYYDNFAGRGSIQVNSFLDLVGFIWSSKSFYHLMGMAFDIWPLLPYHLGWVALWTGLSAYGFRGIHWFLFLSFFPGPDLMVNLVRQETALGMIALFMSLNTPLLASCTFLLHPSALVTVGFLYLARIFEEVFVGSPVRSILLCLVVGIISAWLLTSPFFGMALAKLDAKRGLAEFGSRFIYFVYAEFMIIALLCLSIRTKTMRMVCFGTVALCLFFTVVEIYFYRFLYIVYPFIIYEIGEALSVRAKNRKHLIAWLTTGGRYGLVWLSGMFVMMSLLR